ncbi:probable beta-D-xylosidase 7 [Quercus lobata]|uniref:probable beta-D-xylosidase 7 n=1 Tax=Quercus lobata TaxID=97700 RepID=UPI0012469892|nr:probable beta-D-xylosidase 7 [Quercus lobata]
MEASVLDGQHGSEKTMGNTAFAPCMCCETQISGGGCGFLPHHSPPSATIKVSLQDLADTYQPPLQSCVEQGKASGIMCAYNCVNGVPACADFNLLSLTARGKWGFNGYIVSDYDAVKIMFDGHGYTKTLEDAVVD